MKKQKERKSDKAVRAYREGADVLGSYTGLAEDTLDPNPGVTPRNNQDANRQRNYDGKKIPVQDADDL